MTVKYVDLDVRPALRAGEEPFEQITAAVATLPAGQGLRLFATFKPVPLLHVLGSKGFSHELKELEDGEWEVLFTPEATTEAATEADVVATPAEGVWPDSALTLDNRDLDPPEPMVRILAALEKMHEGEVLSALLCREPVFLMPELAKRGHQWQGAFEGDGATYRILVRVGSSREAAA
ncbi:DUF2249 domain-containing protein [Aminobacter aganoensis]|uniref:Uncharacterized protein (DUF2249 family) n=1 Tax=Aminobacter aganoensis TaxID=83264 RepID=A0A7X0FD23_9HYPH|nr:DUF2249 domain-containing protein [Aminobacter aganoensis]MBB6357516.1 uncharacterized protein (DUF2249 family) [Aminobacter aganoensis]